jgi:anaerobic selenocysteine-containing dehydrogenase/Fe-S-cluster-containing dehydrogenase component
MLEMSRREFLSMTGNAGTAMATGETVKSFDSLTPSLVSPKDIHPGESVFFATTCRECPAGCGMHIRHRDGRVIKAEGNPEHPVNAGALCPRGQSALQGLYDPDRVKSPLMRMSPDKKFAPAEWTESISEIGDRLKRSKGRVIILSGLETGTLIEIMQVFAGAFPRGELILHEPFNYEPLRKAHKAIFGLPVIPDYRLDRCEFVISFASDFLENWISPVQFARQFSLMRTYRAGKMGQFVYLGPRLSLTAANADRFIRLAPGEELKIALAMLKVMDEKGWGSEKIRPALPSIRTVVSQNKLPEGVSPAMIERWTRSFFEAKGSAALAGPAGASGAPARQTASAAAILNYAAGRVGSTVDFSRPHALSEVTVNTGIEQALDGLTKDDILIVNQANPVYCLNSASSRIKKAGTVIYLGTLIDETAELARWILPVDSPLESWGDYEPSKGIHSLMQPTMGRVFDTRPAGDILLDIARTSGRPLSRKGFDKAPGDFRNWLFARWEVLRQKIAPSRPFNDFWQNARSRGGAWENTPPISVRLESKQIGVSFSSAAKLSEEKEAPNACDLWVWPPMMLFDGRVANRGWLQEAPDPISFITWGSWVEIHPHKARMLGIVEHDLVEVRTSYGAIRASARIAEDVAEGVVAAPFGQGHTSLGRNAANRGANLFRLLGETRAGSVFPAARIKKIGKNPKPAYEIWTQRQYHRDLLRWLPLHDLRRMRPGDGEKLILPLPEGYRPGKDIYSPRTYTKHRWAMAIDLARCIGCGACSVACYAENNIAVVGESEIRKGREMTWLQVVPYREDGDSNRLGFLPMLCQHCDAAPCEPVCPVYASVHNEEGLNAQIFNRCIGTRYCSHNCPYKVRRFNWINHDWAGHLPWQLNPEVTARSRGVMEKCTFCIQRIREAEQRAIRENRRIHEGEIRPACAQTCPTRAIVFGDLLDRNAEVTMLTRLDPRRYHVLEDLNTKPAVTYLKRIKVEE